MSFLHAYANPTHEQRVRELARSETPTLFVSLSSEINAEYREFERTSTVVVDAYIKPVMVRYIKRLIEDSFGVSRLRGAACPCTPSLDAAFKGDVPPRL